MEKLPISLCIIVHNAGKKLEELIDKHKDLVSEVIVLDQGSTDETAEIGKAKADFYVRRSHKGFCEPDREYCFDLAKQPYILNLDDDEELSEEGKKVLEKLVQSRGDVFFFKRKNFVDGVDLEELMGDDIQPRLWKKGALRWGERLHEYPEPAMGLKVFFLKEHINHFRTLEGLKKSNLSRNQVADPENEQKQINFVAAVEKYVAEKKNG